MLWVHGVFDGFRARVLRRCVEDEERVMMVVVVRCGDRRWRLWWPAKGGG